MSLYLIKGQYRIVRSQPDGDSVHFFPGAPDAFTRLHLDVRLGAGGAAQLRLDAIDALETHYTPPGHGGHTLHQPLELAHAAGARLLALLGFSDVVRKGEVVTSASPDATPGYILTRFGDKYGRPVSFAFAGDIDRPDLEPVFTDSALLKTSVNHRLTAEGLVYPTFYSKLYPDLRATLTEAADAAREAKAGVWGPDATTSGASIHAQEDLSERLVIMPKLFRRLAEYYALAPGDPSLAGFPSYMATLNDRLYVISDAHATGFDTVVEVAGDTVRLTKPITDLIFMEG
ncbi:nuclease [Actinomadura sp. LD22]|uniref:Nuclease n=1 Tax=Actinomadura physcomitrii TaxID=2650748 RepID=A0A6I4MPF2_9ACTN|nr:nuclease [Actinomadura physcomitrii]